MAHHVLGVAWPEMAAFLAGTQHRWPSRAKACSRIRGVTVWFARSGVAAYQAIASFERG